MNPEHGVLESGNPPYLAEEMIMTFPSSQESETASPLHTDFVVDSKPKVNTEIKEM